MRRVCRDGGGWRRREGGRGKEEGGGRRGKEIEGRGRKGKEGEGGGRTGKEGGGGGGRAQASVCRRRVRANTPSQQVGWPRAESAHALNRMCLRKRGSSLPPHHTTHLLPHHTTHLCLHTLPSLLARAAMCATPTRPSPPGPQGSMCDDADMTRRPSGGGRARTVPPLVQRIILRLPGQRFGCCLEWPRGAPVRHVTAVRVAHSTRQAPAPLVAPRTTRHTGARTLRTARRVARRARVAAVVALLLLAACKDVAARRAHASRTHTRYTCTRVTHTHTRITRSLRGCAIGPA